MRNRSLDNAKKLLDLINAHTNVHNITLDATGSISITMKEKIEPKKVIELIKEQVKPSSHLPMSTQTQPEEMMEKFKALQNKFINPKAGN